MKALCWHGSKDIRCDEVPDPAVEDPRDAIMKVTSCAICGSDLHLYDGYMPAMESGDMMGHEFMGEVVEVGRDAKQLQGRRSRRRSLHHHLRRMRAVPARQLFRLRTDQPQQELGRQDVRAHHGRVCSVTRTSPAATPEVRRNMCGCPSPTRPTSRFHERADRRAGAVPGRHISDRLAGRGAMRHPAERYGSDLGLRTGWSNDDPQCNPARC